jgi:hypothetical protein
MDFMATGWVRRELKERWAAADYFSNGMKPTAVTGMRHLAQARNPYSPPWLWIPGSLAQRKIDARINFAARLAPRNDSVEIPQPRDLAKPLQLLSTNALLTLF